MNPTVRLAAIAAATAALLYAWSQLAYSQTTDPPVAASAPAFSTKSIVCAPKPIAAPASSVWIGSDFTTSATLKCACIKWDCLNADTKALMHYTLCGISPMVDTSSAKVKTIRDAKDPLKSLQTLENRILVEQLSDPKFQECPK